jgi:hypothetical protein
MSDLPFSPHGIWSCHQVVGLLRFLRFAENREMWGEKKTRKPLWLTGFQRAAGEIRTRDLRITNAPLYQLSYSG